jgi:hypothetical protein
VTLKDLLAHPSVKGVCIGCCVRTRASLVEFGHAHLKGDHYEGFICLRSMAELRKGIGDLPAASTSVHELAHLISNQHRGQAFHEVARELGVGREAAQYHPAYKRKRSVRKSER